MQRRPEAAGSGRKRRGGSSPPRRGEPQLQRATEVIDRRPATPPDLSGNVNVVVVTVHGIGALVVDGVQDRLLHGSRRTRGRPGPEPQMPVSRSMPS